jgi:hypothetical protein
MQINLTEVKRGRLEDFANAHGLVMDVVERDRPIGDPMRFYAKFDGAWVKDGCFIRSTHGDGATPEAAIADYARLISGKTLVVHESDIHSPDSREIRVWKLDV